MLNCIGRDPVATAPGSEFIDPLSISRLRGNGDVNDIGRDPVATAPGSEFADP